MNRERSRLVRRAGRVRDARVLSRPCYLCDAPVGARCIDISRGYERPPHKTRIRAALAAVALLAVLATGCWGDPVVAYCRIDDLPEQPCPAQPVGNEAWLGKVTGADIASWYPDLEPGVHTFTVRYGEASDTWTFQLTNQEQA